MKYNYVLSLTAITLLLNSSALFAQEKDDKDKDKEKEQKENSKWTTGGNKIDATDWLGTKNNFPLIFKTNKTEYLRLNTTGYFGVGVNNPLVPLHVGGQIRSNFLSGTGFRLLQTDNLGNVNFFTGGNSNQVLYGNGIWGELPAFPAAVDWKVTGNDMNSIPSGNIGMGTTAPATEKLEVNGNIKATKIIASIFDSPNTTFAFGTHSIIVNPSTNSIYTDNAPLLIQSNPDFNFNTIINAGNSGMVGIGTSTPTQALDVSGNTNISGNATIGQNTTVGGTLNAVDVAVSGTLNATNLALSGTVNASSMAVGGNVAANCLSSVSMIVSGLATVDNLKVNGDFATNQITTSHISAASNNLINFGSNNALSINTLTGNTTIAGTLNVASMKMDGSLPNAFNRSLMIDALGNIVPGLAIVDPNQFPSSGPCGSGFTAAGYVQAASNPSWVPTVNTTLNKPIMYLCDPDGFVGLGTTYPLARLDISTVNDVGLNISTHGADYSYGFRVQANKDLTKAISVERPSALKGKDPTTTFMVLGNGEVYATDITIQTPAFPDYVFEKNYNLMPLKDLEKYITINKHLPNIPTAKDIAKSGLSVGKIETSVVEKIEELTLYMIELKKENEVLKADMEILKTKIK